MTYAEVLARIRRTLVDLHVTVFARVAAIAQARQHSAQHFAFAVLARTRVTIVDLALALGSFIPGRTFTFVAGHLIDARTSVFTLDIFTIVHVLLASFAAEAKFART